MYNTVNITYESLNHFKKYILTATNCFVLVKGTISDKFSVSISIIFEFVLIKCMSSIRIWANMQTEIYVYLLSSLCIFHASILTFLCSHTQVYISMQTH